MLIRDCIFNYEFFKICYDNSIIFATILEFEEDF